MSMHERDELEMDARQEDREERYQTARDELGEWLDCGCHSNQRDHTCGERERSDEDDERDVQEASDMDPNATLAELRQAIKDWRAIGQVYTDIMASGDRMAELAEALDEWLTKGSFLPAEWVHPRRCWFCGAGHAPDRKD